LIHERPSEVAWVDGSTGEPLPGTYVIAKGAFDETSELQVATLTIPKTALETLSNGSVFRCDVQLPGGGVAARNVNVYVEPDDGKMVLFNHILVYNMFAVKQHRSRLIAVVLLQHCSRLTATLQSSYCKQHLLL